jgi:hypothetical protein
MELKAKIVQVLPVTGGTSTTGKDWKSQQVIVETFGEYPKKVCLKTFNKFIDEFKVGQTCTFHLNLESREYNGKWYNDINVWKYDKEGEEVNNEPQPIDLGVCDNGSNLPF